MKKIFWILFILLISPSVKSQKIDTLLNVNGQSLHFVIIKGNGTPILFESGNGGDSEDWTSILDELHNKTNATLITYDRAGLNKSSIDTTKISFKIEVKNLEEVLCKLHYDGKIFLVAHSFGGYYSSFFAYRNKSKVKGAVFIDVATPCYFTQKWTENYINTLKVEDWEWIRKNKVGLFYVLKRLPQITKYMADKYLTNSTPLTLIRAEGIPAAPLVYENEKEKWVSCLDNFGKLPFHKLVVAKGAEHVVWEKSPQLVISEIVELYKRVNKDDH